MRRPKRQRGAAILMAMLTVVLVATLAASMLWQQWRGVEVETAQRVRVQSAWVLTGALDWARLIVREDARQGGADHLAEPWSVPLAPARLSTFLAAERGEALVGDEGGSEQDAFLAGNIQDLQARLNATNLVSGGKLHEPSVAAWARLFKLLNLPEAELVLLTDNLLASSASAASATSETPVQPNRPLQPQNVSDLVWLGLSPTTLQALKPYITLLPVRTPVNLNTAPPEVLVASVARLDLAQARSLVAARALRHMATLDDARQLLGNPEIQLNDEAHALSSRFFGVTGQLRVGQTTLQEYSLLQRDGMTVKVLMRSRGAQLDQPPLLQ